MKNRISVSHLRIGLTACAMLLTCSALAQLGGETRRSRMVLADRGLPPLHLKSHLVNAAITGRIAKITAESVYRNDSSRELEATFVFPLPEGATVERFTMWMNGEPVEAKVAEKDRARATYESIVNRRKDPGLIEQIGDGLFQMRIYPVLPNSDQKVRIEYSQVIPMNQNGKALLFSYPLACDAPRTPEASIVQDFVVALTLDMEGPIASLESDTHRISRHIDANQKHKARVSIEEGLATLDKDFVLKIALEKRRRRRSAFWPTVRRPTATMRKTAR
jgi:Ca-activated chloride channel homolog